MKTRYDFPQKDFAGKEKKRAVTRLLTLMGTIAPAKKGAQIAPTADDPMDVGKPDPWLQIVKDEIFVEELVWRLDEALAKRRRQKRGRTIKRRAPQKKDVPPLRGPTLKRALFVADAMLCLRNAERYLKDNDINEAVLAFRELGICLERLKSSVPTHIREANEKRSGEVGAVRLRIREAIGKIGADKRPIDYLYWLTNRYRWVVEEECVWSGPGNAPDRKKLVTWDSFQSQVSKEKALQRRPLSGAAGLSYTSYL